MHFEFEWLIGSKVVWIIRQFPDSREHTIQKKEHLICILCHNIYELKPRMIQCNAMDTMMSKVQVSNSSSFELKIELNEGFVNMLILFVANAFIFLFISES